MNDTYVIYKIQKKRRAVTQIRLSAHKLPVETGRYLRIAHDERICSYCRMYVGDEIHCLFKCFHPTLSTVRETFMDTLYSINPSLKCLPRDCLFLYVMSFKDKSIMKCTATYVDSKHNI